MKESKGSKVLQSFAPNWSDPDLLERMLAGRRDLVDKLEKLAIDGAEGNSMHQRLIIGPRGSGKTHVISVLYKRLENNEKLRDKLMVVHLLEDEAGVASFLDFIVRCLKAVARLNTDKKWIEEKLETIYDMPHGAMEDYAVRLFLEAAGDKRVLILVENLDIIFDKVTGFGKPGQQALRDLIQQHPRIMIFATSQQLMAGVQEHHAPFFGHFTIKHLKKLTFEEAEAFLSDMAVAYENSELAEFMNTPEGRARLRSIYHFTGGNHRLLVTFFSFLKADSVTRLSEQFLSSLNTLRPFYQEQMRRLTAQQQKIVQYLCLEREPRTVKDIARGCLATHNTVSSQLKHLLDCGFVDRIQKGRESYYEIKEYLFRIVYEADLEQDGGPVKLFVDFLSGFYSSKELELRYYGYSLLAGKVPDTGPNPFMPEANIYKYALLKIGRSVENMEDAPGDSGALLATLFDEGLYDDVVRFGDLFEGVGEKCHHCEKAFAHYKKNNISKAFEEASKALSDNPDDYRANVVMAMALSNENYRDMEKSLMHARKALEQYNKDAITYELIGTTYADNKCYQEALDLFNECVLLYPENMFVWSTIGAIKLALNDVAGAEEALKTALENSGGREVFKNIVLKGLNYIGVGKLDSGDHFGALKLSQIIVETDPSFQQGWILKGRSEYAAGKIYESEKSYQKAIVIERNLEAIGGLASVEFALSKYSPAIELFEEAIAIDPKQHILWDLKAAAEIHLKEYESAELSLENALKIDPNDSFTLSEYGRLKMETGDPESANMFFERAIQNGAKTKDIYVDQGVALRNKNQHRESIEYFDKALKEESDSYIYYCLSNAHLNTGDIEKAVEYAKNGIQHIDSHSGNKYVLMNNWVRGRLKELFEASNKHVKGSFLAEVLDSLIENGHKDVFENELARFIFEALKKHGEIPGERYKKFADAIEAVAAGKVDLSVHLKFLRIGISYYFSSNTPGHVNDMALLELPREERAMFMEELGISL